MKAWRERLAEARERGCFTRDDKVSIMSFERCMIGEVATGLFGPEWEDLRPGAVVPCDRCRKPVALTPVQMGVGERLEPMRAICAICAGKGTT